MDFRPLKKTLVRIVTELEEDGSSLVGLIDALESMDGEKVRLVTAELLLREETLEAKESLKSVINDCLMATLQFGTAVIKNDKVSAITAVSHAVNAEVKLAIVKGDNRLLQGRYIVPPDQIC